MKIHKILNNNFVIILNEYNEELIIGGKGIAFSKKVGDIVDDEAVNKTFVLPGNFEDNMVQKFVEALPIEYFEAAISIVDFAKIKVKKDINQSVCLAIADHIYSTIQRYEKGIQIPNYMLWELKKIYMVEFEVGLYALDLIKEQFGIEFSEDEAGFIAMHIVNSELEQSNLQEVYKTTIFIKEITNIVKYFFNVDFDNDSIYYYRFITHLKFFASRLFNDYPTSKKDDVVLYEMIKTNYKNSFNCTLKIEEFLLNNYSYTLSKEEHVYLTIHIENVIYKANKEEN